MTRFSGRFALALIATFALALAPVLYARQAPERDECDGDAALFDAEALSPEAVLVTDGPRATNAKKRRLTATIGADDPKRSPMIFTILRTFGLPNPLLQPAAALPGKREPDAITERTLDVGGTPIPVRYGTERFTDTVRTTAYFMAYRGEPISSPLWARMRSAPSEFGSGAWPITLFVVSTRAHPARTDEVEARLDDWVRAAFTHYRAVCTGG